MNYLAHLLLSHQTPEAITGAILGDFVKGRTAPGWSPAVQDAIRLHRAIDRYTDRHPLALASRALVSPARRRFAGVLVDVFYDHFLARHWHRFHDRALADFARDVYGVLLPQRARFPERLQRMLPYMAHDDWLGAYAEVAAVARALQGMARRLRYPARAAPLASAIEELERNYGALEAHFGAFFPQLRAYAASPGVRAPDVAGARHPARARTT